MRGVNIARTISKHSLRLKLIYALTMSSSMLSACEFLIIRSLPSDKSGGRTSLALNSLLLGNGKLK